MHSSRRCSLYRDRSTSVGDIGLSFNSLCIDDDYIPTLAKKKFRPEPTVVKPSRTTNMRSKDHSKPDEQSDAVAELSPHVPAANSMAKDKEQRSTRPRPSVTKRIFFIGSPERELPAAKKIDEDDELGLFGKFIKKCRLCKTEFKPDKDIYMYGDRRFCSANCRVDRIVLDGFNIKDFGLGKEDQKTMKSLRKNLNQLQMYL